MFLRGAKIQYFLIYPAAAKHDSNILLIIKKKKRKDGRKTIYVINQPEIVYRSAKNSSHFYSIRD